jgi:hypothetical protein
MSEWRSSRFRNPLAWYTAIAAGMLAFSLWVPWLSATRTARVEGRADKVAAALMTAADGFELPLEEPDLQSLLARFYRTATSSGVRAKDVVRVEPAPSGSLMCLQNKHYAFLLSEAPVDPMSRIGKNTVGSLEVLAWPLSVVGPGHCGFFYAQDACRAYTRNLQRGYAGLKDDTRPLPGAGHRRPGIGSRRQSQYPGNDSERWILY